MCTSNNLDFSAASAFAELSLLLSSSDFYQPLVTRFSVKIRETESVIVACHRGIEGSLSFQLVSKLKHGEDNCKVSDLSGFFLTIARKIGKDYRSRLEYTLDNR
jgi:hypothetical protein